jgi:tRNA(His) 5'-end guanylyltransferase
MKKDSLGNRMKDNYENAYRIKLTRRTPVIIRLDGKAFHTLTKSCEKPFDENFNKSMVGTMRALCEEIQGVKCAYTQSDEISLLLTDFDTIDTQAWFDYNLQKLVSISAGMATIAFYKLYRLTGIFDARAFNIPKDEVKNYFIWRQIDWERNSIQMLAQAHYSHKELHKKNKADMHEMLHEKGINWADLEPKWKNGTFLFKDQEKINGEVVNSKWESLDNLILTRDERPVIGHVFDYLIWDKEKFTHPVDVFKIES